MMTMLMESSRRGYGGLINREAKAGDVPHLAITCKDGDCMCTLRSRL